MRVKFKFKLLSIAFLLFILFVCTFKTNTISINKIDYYYPTNDNYYDSSYNYEDSDSGYNDEPSIDTSSYINDKINNYNLIIEDDANLLNNDEKLSLYDEMKKVTKYGNVIFKTINYNQYTSTATYAERFFHSKVNQRESGILFLIDMDKREIYIFSDGLINETITRSKALSITDNTYKYASNSDYFGCAFEAFKEINTLLSGRAIIEPMRIITSLIFSIVMAALIGFLVAIKKASLKVASSKDTVNKLNKKIEVVGEINGILAYTRSVYNPPSSSSSGGGSSSSSGGGGGGHSSGSGGGHRF